MKIQRRKSRKVWVGNVPVGGDAPITVQSMTKTDTRNVDDTVKQIKSLEEVRCDIVRVAVPDKKAAYALREIKAQINLPLVADVHFDYHLALIALENGADKLRINPGNIRKEHLAIVVKAAQEKGIPIRIGINSGSLEKDLLEKYGHPTAESLVESALRQLEFMEKMNFHSIIISLKGSDVLTMVEAYRLIASRTDYPLHLGVTEAGLSPGGIVRSAIGVGSLLMEGIGDTLRISLSGPPEEEVKVGREILKSLGLRTLGPLVISCPTCGRAEIDVINIASKVEAAVQHFSQPWKIAVMGCVVNGPGEAREADFGVAGGRHGSIIFRRGEILRRVRNDELVPALLEEIAKEGGYSVSEETLAGDKC